MDYSRKNCMSEPTQQDPAHITPFGGNPTVQQNALKPPIAMTGPALGTIPSGGGKAVFSGTPQKKPTMNLTPDGNDSPEKTIILKKKKKDKKTKKTKKTRKKSSDNDSDPDYEPDTDCNKQPAIKKAYALRKHVTTPVSNPDGPINLISDDDQIPSELNTNNKTERNFSPLPTLGQALASPNSNNSTIPFDVDSDLKQHGVLENVNNSPLNPIKTRIDYF